MRLVAWLRNEADSEPIPVVAGVVAVALHAVFIGALFSSMNWHQKVLSRATIKIWHSMPVSRPQTLPSEAAPRRVMPPKDKAGASPVEPAVSAPPVSPPQVQRPPPPPTVVAPAPAQLPAPAPAPPPVAKAAPPVAPPPVAPVTPPAAQAPSSPPPEPVPPAPQTSPAPSPPVAEPTMADEAVDVEAQRREKALALAERLREEENTPANETMDREREARRATFEKRRVERDRELARKLQEATAIATTARAQEQAEEATGAQTLALIDEYRARISAKVRQRVVLPAGLRGNPEAVFEVTLLPGGEIAGVRLRKSSGIATLDASVERAILAAQPLPVPDDPEIFDSHFRKFLLNFRPKL